MITREQLEARIACIGDCGKCPVVRSICNASIGVARQMLTLMDDNQRLTERNEKLVEMLREVIAWPVQNMDFWGRVERLAVMLDALCAAPTPPKEDTE